MAKASPNPTRKAIIVCGSRKGFTPEGSDTFERMLTEETTKWKEPPLIIHGDCRGVDREASAIAARYGCPSLPLPADWGYRKKKAGPFRNQRMAQVGLMLQDCLYEVEVWAFPSNRVVNGTLGMVNAARNVGLSGEVVHNCVPDDQDNPGKE